MAREIHRLKPKQIEHAKVPGYYADGGGLYLQVSPSLSKSWIFRYARLGKSREMGLGPARDVTLVEARGKAGDYRRLLLSGCDPIEARDASKAQEMAKAADSRTFSKCAKDYIKAHRPGWRNPKHAEQWTSTLATYADPIIGSRPVRDIDTALVLRVLEPIWTTKTETATRLRGRIERILTWAAGRGYRSGENPARWRGHLKEILPAPAKLLKLSREHHAALPYDEIGAFMRDLRAQEGTAARALEFLILNTSRTNEVIGAKRAELDLNKQLWTIPAERMKSGNEHRVPLSARALEIVKVQPAGGYLFAGMKEGAPLSNMAMLELLKRMGRGDLTVHGFRSTFRDWAAECTSYSNEVCEMALAHAIGDKVEAAYRRGDLFEKRRRLMLEWAKYCESPKVSGVSPIRRAA